MHLASIFYLSNLIFLQHSRNRLYFYSASALLTMQTAVLARGYLSVRPSVRPSRSGVLFR